MGLRCVCVVLAVELRTLAPSYSGTLVHKLNLFYHFGKEGPVCAGVGKKAAVMFVT